MQQRLSLLTEMPCLASLVMALTSTWLIREMMFRRSVATVSFSFSVMATPSSGEAEGPRFPVVLRPPFLSWYVEGVRI